MGFNPSFLGQGQAIWPILVAIKPSELVGDNNVELHGTCNNQLGLFHWKFICNFCKVVSTSAKKKNQIVN